MHKRRWIVATLFAILAASATMIVDRGGGTGEEAMEMGPKFTKAVAAYGCNDSTSSYACLQIVLNGVLDTEGVRQALVLVKKLDQEISPEPFACHPLVHGIGRRLVVEKGAEALKEALDANDPVCESGFIHGSFEALGTLYSGEQLRLIVKEACGSTRGVLYEDCTHASGHAFAIAEPKNISQAINGCSEFDPVSEHCARGVVMAYAIGSPKFSELHDPTWDSGWGWVGFDAKQLNGACDELREDWKVPCWEFLWNGYASHADRISPKDYFSNCPSSGEPYWDICVRNGGRLLLYSIEDDEEAVERCAEYSGSRSQCLRGIALSLLLDDRYLGVDAETRSSICSSPKWRESERAECWAGERDAG